MSAPPPHPGYGHPIDAALDALTHLTDDDRKRLAIALLDQAGIRVREQAAIAQLLGLVYEDGEILICWACSRVGAVIRTDQPAGFGRIACERCDEEERDTWTRVAIRDRQRDAFEAACDAAVDAHKEVAA